MITAETENRHSEPEQFERGGRNHNEIELDKFVEDGIDCYSNSMRDGIGALSTYVVLVGEVPDTIIRPIDCQLQDKESSIEAMEIYPLDNLTIAQ